MKNILPYSIEKTVNNKIAGNKKAEPFLALLFKSKSILVNTFWEGLDLAGFDHGDQGFDFGF